MSEDPVDSDTEGEAVDADGEDDSHINERDDGRGYQIEYADGTEPSPSANRDNGQNKENLTPSEQGKEIEPEQADPIESNAEVSSEQFDPNESESGVEQEEFNPNDLDGDLEPDQFNPNEDGEKYESDFDPNEPEGNIEQEEIDPNDPAGELEPEQFDPNEKGQINEENEFDPNDESHFDPNEQVEEIEPEQNRENINSQSTSTVLVNENKEEMQKVDQEELEKEIDKELEEGVDAISKYLEEEAEFINAYEELLGAYNAEQLYESMKEEEANKNEEISEEIDNEKEAKQGEEVSEPQLSEEISEQEVIEEEELEERQEEIEQHQVEPLIEEALETEPEPIINEEEIEGLQEMGFKEQFENVHLNEQIQDILEGQEEEIEQEHEEKVEVQTDKEINYDLEEELGLDLVEQHQIEPLIEEAVETEPVLAHNEEEIDQLQELELEEQFEIVQNNEYTEELVERLEELEEHNDENDNNVQENEEIEQTQERKESNYLQEKLDEQEWNLELDYEEKDEVEQHQVEAAIEEELETEAEPIVNEEKLEHIKNLEPEKQLEAELFYELIEELAERQYEEKDEGREREEPKELTKEEKVAQITRELEITQEINSTETEVERESQEVEFEQEIILQDKEVDEQSEIAETKDHQQELEEILEQNRKIEQEALAEIEQDEQKSEKTAKENYERAKELYRQQTGKRPIYASKETKGFQEWLEQSELKQKEEEEKEQEKEEMWKWTLKNWIVRASEIGNELKSELLKLVEKYKELEKLIKKYTQLYNKAQREKLSQAEKNELKSLIKKLQKLDPAKIELFLGLREMKRYLDEQYYNNDFWDKPYVNRVRHHFFTKLSQRYKNLKEENIKEILKIWIENASEEEMNLELKGELIKIVENYNQLAELTTRFMELYIKAQHGKLSNTEKHELKTLIELLQEFKPIQIDLFASIRAIKKFLTDQDFSYFSDKSRVNRILNRFFTHRRLVSTKQKLFKKYLHDKNGNIIPYLDIGKDVLQLTPSEFKRTYKGVYSQYFKMVRNNHNLHLGIKTVGELLKKFRSMNVYGIVYKISLIRDVYGNKLKSGPIIFYTKNKKAKEGLIRIGRTINLGSRVAVYRYESNTHRKNLHFENAFFKYGPRAFKITLLTVCKTANEYKASEYFWTLFYNKKADRIGYDLSINKFFNPMIGSRGDLFKKYEVPKWKLTSHILRGFERAELDVLWENVPLGTLKGRVKEYFNVSNLYQIRLNLAKPYLDKCLRCGFTKEETLNYLLQNGFCMFSEEEYQARIKAFGSEIKRSSPDRLFQRMIKNMQNNYYHIPLRKVTGRSTSYYEQLRLNLFIIPYSNYLKSIGVKEKLQKPSINYDYKTHRFRSLNLEDIQESLKEFSIIEHLVKLNASNIQIAYALNLCKADDDVRVRENARGKIDIYFERYKRRIAKITGVQVNNVSTDDVRSFIKSSKSGLPEYNNYIKKEEL